MGRPEVTGHKRPDLYASSERGRVQPRAPPDLAVPPSDEAQTSKRLPCNIPRGALRIPEFARSHGFSRSYYYV